MSNIDSTITRTEPFIYISSSDNREEFVNGIRYYKSEKNYFRESAYKLANKLYKFDSYMNRIVDKTKKLQ